MPSPHRTPDHKKIVASLAAEFDAPIDEVATLYERERAGLSAQAKVTTFLHVLAVRQVQEILRQRAPLTNSH
jgi:hypothetical protein